MTPDQQEEIVNLITARIEATLEARFKETWRLIAQVQQVVDIQAGNTDEDRKDFAQMKVNQASIDQGVKEVLDMVGQMSKRITDKVTDQTNATIEKAADRVAESVEPALDRAVKKVKNGVPLLQKKPFWKFWG